MRRIGLSILGCIATCIFAGADWMQFRGPNGSSIADSKLPLNWSDKENTAWKADLPGRGPSSPIVVKGRVIVTCSDGPRQDQLYVICFDTKSGAQLWRRKFWATGRTFSHPYSAIAAPTPASDGDRIYAFFSSTDLICLNLDGDLQWYRGLSHDYPKAGSDVGMASSPVVIKDTVVVQIENQGNSFAVGINSLSGETRWRVPRDPTANWSSPAVLLGKGKRKTAVLLQSPGGMTGHDPVTGQQLWQLDESFGTIVSPLAIGNRVYAPSNGLTALQFSDESDAPEIAWQSNKLGASSSSPVLFQGRIYTISGSVLKCGDAADGKVVWQLRLGGRFWGTPVIAGSHLYCVNEAGDAYVVSLTGEKGKIVSQPKFGETVQTSPAVADGALYVRSDQHLWKIAK